MNDRCDSEPMPAILTSRRAVVQLNLEFTLTLDVKAYICCDDAAPFAWTTANQMFPATLAPAIASGCTSPWWSWWMLLRLRAGIAQALWRCAGADLSLSLGKAARSSCCGCHLVPSGGWCPDGLLGPLSPGKVNCPRPHATSGHLSVSLACNRPDDGASRPLGLTSMDC